MQFTRLGLIIGLLFISNFTFGAPIQADKLFTSPTYSRVAISPDAKYLSVYYRDKNNHYISIVDQSSNKFVSNTPISYDYTLRNYYWLNSEYIYLQFGTQLGTADIIARVEEGKLYLSAVEGAGALISPLKNNPKNILYARSKNKYSKDYVLYSMTVEDLLNDDFSNAIEILDELQLISTYYYSEERDRLYFNEYDEKNDQITIKSLDLKTGNKKTLLRLSNDKFPIRFVGSIDENTIGILTNSDSDKVVLRKFNSATNTFGEIIYEHPDFDLIGASIDNNGRLDFVQYMQHGLVHTQYFTDEQNQFSKQIAKLFNKSEFYFIDKDSAEKNLVLFISGTTLPGEFFLYNVDKKELKPLLLSYPQLENEHFVRSKRISLTSTDNLKLEGYLTLPQGWDYSTLLVMPHGGPIQTRDNDRFNSIVQYYVSRGFAVLRVNFRGSSGFGKSFVDKGVGQVGRAIEQDISMFVDNVLSTHKFRNVCSIGMSYGGYSSVMLAMNNPKRYRCVVASFGIYDLPLVYNASNRKLTEDYQKRVTNTLGEYSEELRRYSPVYLTHKLQSPLLLLAGKLDKVADFEHSNRLKYVLEKDNHQFEHFFYKTSGHGHSNWLGDRHQSSLTFDYLVRTLNLTVPEPESLTQAARLAIAKDYANIADGYAYEYGQEKDMEKAITYYQLASKYGDGEASYFLGTEYKEGINVEYDLKKAFDYFQLGANQDFGLAHENLGKMYLNAELVERNWALAKKHLVKAFELDDNSRSRTSLARFYCAAPQELRDFSQCLKLLDVRQFKNESNRSYRRAKNLAGAAIAWIVAESVMSESEKKQLQQLAKDIYELNQMNLTVDVLRAGEFVYEESEKFGKRGKYQLIDESFRVIKKDSESGGFGLEFGIDIEGFDQYSDRVALVIRWVRIDQAGKEVNFDNHLFYGGPNTTFRFLGSYEDIMEDGMWRLELRDLHQNLLYSKEFEVVVPSQKAATDKAI